MKTGRNRDGGGRARSLDQLTGRRQGRAVAVDPRRRTACATRLASKIATAPGPQPMSATLAPAVMPAAASVWVLVLAVVQRLGGLRLRRPVEQEAEVGSDERVWRRDRVGVVHGSVLPRERDVAGILAQAVLELGADLAGPELEPARRVLHDLLELGDLPGLLF